MILGANSLGSVALGGLVHTVSIVRITTEIAVVCATRSMAGMEAEIVAGVRAMAGTDREVVVQVRAVVVTERVLSAGVRALVAADRSVICQVRSTVVMMRLLQAAVRVLVSTEAEIKAGVRSLVAADRIILCRVRAGEPPVIIVIGEKDQSGRVSAGAGEAVADMAGGPNGGMVLSGKEGGVRLTIGQAKAVT